MGILFSRDKPPQKKEWEQLKVSIGEVFETLAKNGHILNNTSLENLSASNIIKVIENKTREEVNKELEDLKQKNKEMSIGASKQLDEIKGELYAIEQEFSILQQKYSSLQDEQTKRQHEFYHLKEENNKLHQATGNIAELKHFVEEIVEHKRQFQNSWKKERWYRVKLQDIVSNKEKHINTLQSKIIDQEKELAIVQQNLEASEVKIAELSERLQYYRSEKEELLQMNKKLEQVINRNSSDLETPVVSQSFHTVPITFAITCKNTANFRLKMRTTLQKLESELESKIREKAHRDHFNYSRFSLFTDKGELLNVDQTEPPPSQMNLELELHEYSSRIWN